MALVCDGQGLIEVNLIMDAVNQNETDIAIGAAADVVQNGRITANEADIIDLNSRVVAVENSDIVAVEARVTVNETDIATNIADILINKGNITTNTNNAVSLAARVTQNEADMVTNDALTDANTSGLITANLTLVDHESRISAVESAIGVGLEVLVVHETADTINGGTSVANTWTARTIDTVRYNTLGATTGADTVTIDAGTYYLQGMAMVVGSAHQSRISVGGTSFIHGTTHNSDGQSTIMGKITLASATPIKIETNVTTAVTNTGFGAASSFTTTNMYVMLLIKKVG